jgi:hypothetical protein
VLVWATTAFCVVRAVPVMWEGWKYLALVDAGGGGDPAANEAPLRGSAARITTRKPLRLPAPAVAQVTR